MRVGAGAVLGLVGPNGSGKTTLYRLILGLMDPVVGSITVDGERPALYRRRRGIGYLPEQVRLPPALKVCELARFVGALACGGAEQVGRTMDSLVAELELEGRVATPIGALSHGYRQRVGLLAALIGDPALLLLDEPTNGLDPASVGILRGLIRGLRRAGRTVLVSSHNLFELERLCDSVVILRDGRVLGRVSRDELSSRPDVWVVQLIPDERRDPALESISNGLGAVRLAADELALDNESAAKRLAARLREAGVTVECVERRRYDLEILFHSLLNEETRRGC